MILQRPSKGTIQQMGEQMIEQMTEQSNGREGN